MGPPQSGHRGPEKGARSASQNRSVDAGHRLLSGLADLKQIRGYRYSSFMLTPLAPFSNRRK
jgi:hypothetical protein